MKIIFVFFIVWFLLAAIGYCIGFLVFEQDNMEDFAKRGVLTHGKVIAKEPHNHETLRYVYFVNGTEYSGIGGAGRGNPGFDEIQIGQDVIVYYVPETPDKSVLGNPGIRAGVDRNLILLGAVLFSVFPMLIILTIYFVVRKAMKTP